MMLFKLFLVALTSLSVLSRTAAENPSSSDEFDKIIHRAMESTDIRELYEERTLSILRDLEVSQTCLNETAAIAEDKDVAAYIESVGDGLSYYDYNTCDIDANQSKKTITAECDMESLAPELQNVCEDAGGQYYTVTMEISGKENGVKIKIVYKDIGICAGASCDTDALVEEAKSELDATKSQWESTGYSVKISGSGFKSTYFTLWIAVFSTFAFFLI